MKASSMTAYVSIAATAIVLLPVLAVAQDERTAEHKKLTFSGYEWRLKSSGEKRVGPGPCHFSDSEENVSLDDRGWLHLRITQREGRWYCPELISLKTFGFGTYRFYLASPLARIDPNVILGLFTWSDSREFTHREIDIECSKWGEADDKNNVQFVVQPYQPPGHLLRFEIPPNMTASTVSFTWESDRVDFQCLAGHAAAPTTTHPLIREWTFSKNAVPQPGDENVRINFWLFGGRPPLDANQAEAIISKFEFVPLAAKAPAMAPSVVITDRPRVSLLPDPVRTGPISGKVSGIEADHCRVVVFAHGDKWYVQPTTAAPYTTVKKNGTWTTRTHGGTEYAAALVKPSYKPPVTTDSLPKVGGDVLAVATVKPRE